MTKFRAALVVILAVSFSVDLSAAPPTELSGKFTLLNGDRIEFADSDSGTNSGQGVTYAYAVLDAVSASLDVLYPETGRRREITLNFLPDGSPDGYTEFEFQSSGPPLPPVVRSGNFEIGDLEMEPPVIESSAPDALTGFFTKFGRERFEFLTDGNGRVFKPGNAAYFTYSYTIVDELSAELIASFEDGVRVSQFLLTFDEEGAAVSYIESGGSDSEPEEFELRLNRNLGDLTIGESEFDQVGDDYFASHGSRQTVKSRSNSEDPVEYLFMIENDGDVDSFVLRGKKGKRKYDVKYSRLGSGENITAAVIAGIFQTSELGHRAKEGFIMEVTPKKTRVSIPLYVMAASTTNAQATDMVRAKTKVKVKNERGAGSGGSDQLGNGNAGNGGNGNPGNGNGGSNGNGKGKGRN